MWNRTQWLILVIINLNCAFIIPLAQSPVPPGKNDDLKPYLSNLPFPLADLQLPVIPDRTFSITEFGAVGDGLTLNTEAFRQAIETCTQAGGGRVVVPPGVWLSGPIQLQSRIDLHLQRGALLLFSRRFEDYLVVPAVFEGMGGVRCASPISAIRQENIAITGEGIIDGSGDAWRPVKKFKMTDAQWKKLLASGGVVHRQSNTWYPSAEAMHGEQLLQQLQAAGRPVALKEYARAREYLRPVMISLIDCKKVLLDGPTFQNSPAWNIHPLQCEDLVIRNLTVLNPWYSQNGDGLDLDSCRRVLVYNCRFDVGDDAICIKSGKDEEGRKRAQPCQEIIISDCVVYHGHGGFTIGSEMSGGVHHVVVRRCTFLGTDVGLRFKTTRGRGGVVEQIYIQDIRMKDIPTDAIGFNMYYGGDAPLAESDSGSTGAVRKPFAVDAGTPRFQHIYLKNILCNGAARAIQLEGLPEMAIRNLELENILISAQRGLDCIDAEQIVFKNVRILPQTGPVFTFHNSRNITLQKVEGPEGAAVFLMVEGDQSNRIRLLETDLKRYKQGIALGRGVPADVVITP